MARAPAVQEVEAQPEADRLDGFPHPRETQALFGHAAAEQSLAAAFAGGRMHHAWLLAGRAGIGKATLAYRLARHVLARQEERDPSGKSLEVSAGSAAARQVAALSHAGLLVLRRPYDAKAKRFGSAIPVDEVRRLKSFLGLTSGDETWRVVIVDAADELNLNAANALLKSLEEPPRRALFLLIASEPSGLLPTILSRCRRLDLQPLAAGPLRQATDAAVAAADVEKPTTEQWDQFERLAAGSVRRALQLAASGGLDLHQRLAGIFAQLPAVDWTAAHTLTDSLAAAAQEQRFAVFFELLLDTLAHLVRARATGQGAPADVALAKRLIPESGVPQWAALWEAILRDKTDADELNLDRKALIMRILARLESAARM
ncbi:MAG: DNA polymerase III subunit delta' [Hyphomonadaceae bacterium]|jgi:DNA polymerase-3 subunit delta'|nr:DNA polymerase III subunit delta' [Hyphomonadaceae bacterium]